MKTPPDGDRSPLRPHAAAAELRVIAGDRSSSCKPLCGVPWAFLALPLCFNWVGRGPLLTQAKLLWKGPNQQEVQQCAAGARPP